jgi:beta-glucosidase/6-phospho-beta-glucosidase/beta-galactosidase
MTVRVGVETSRLFKSFWLAGFESACHINRARQRLDMLAITQHDQQVRTDYNLLRDIGIKTARDGIRWHLVERAGQYDFSSLAPMVEAANDLGIQVIWNICHYGCPDDLDVFSPTFVDRFARFCKVVARFLKHYSDGVPFFVPLNEISFLAWAAGEVGYICPFGCDRGFELKHQLIRATIAGCEAVWSETPQARIVHVEPLINVVAPRERPDLAEKAAEKTASQFEAWDMLSGRSNPHLGGHPRYLDIIGVNYYHSNQWEYPDQRLRWEDNPRDERWIPLHRLLARVYERYQRPLFISETSHFGVGRGPWIREVADEVTQAQINGVPVEGICLYPVLDRPDWDNLDHWHNSGLWDLRPDGQGRLQRILNEDYAAELKRVWPSVVSIR